VVRTYPGTPGQAPVSRVPSGSELQPQADRVAVQTWQDLDASKTASRPVTTVTVDVGAYDQVVVTINAHAMNLLPGIFPSLPITATASGPIEIFKRKGTN
jgi:hypothetical protein